MRGIQEELKFRNGTVSTLLLPPVPDAMQHPVILLDLGYLHAPINEAGYLIS